MEKIHQNKLNRSEMGESKPLQEEKVYHFNPHKGVLGRKL